MPHRDVIVAANIEALANPAIIEIVEEAARFYEAELHHFYGAKAAPMSTSTPGSVLHCRAWLGLESIT
jgi:hypothetical protein